MADEWLRADQVADLAVDHVARGRSCGYCLDPWPCAAAQMVAQDGRWRALVGALLGHIEHAPKCPAAAPMYVEYCECGLNTVLAQAQVALADAPPAPRGAAE